MKKRIGLCLLIISLLTACSGMSTEDKKSTVGAAVGYYIPKVMSQTQAIDAVGGVVFQVGDYVTIVLPMDGVFDIGTANFLQTADALIDESADIIRSSPDSLVLVTAHSDNIGSALSSAKLTRKQAMRVALALWESRRVDTKTFERFQFIGMGGTKPIADNATPRGQTLNRRIQITIYPKTMTASVDAVMAGQPVEAV